MKEIPCLFGHNQSLAGIITEPVLSEQKKPDRQKAVILISAGLLPMSGPFRLYTNLARKLALEGILTLRFDLGGIGESRSIQPSIPLADRTAQEISTAIDYLLEQYPTIQYLTLGGLCSGAEDAFRASDKDSRITGVILIDPFAYRTPGWAWRQCIHRFTRRIMRATGFYHPVPLRSSCALHGA
jgi:alpha/beta superfamily hydrolase